MKFNKRIVTVILSAVMVFGIATPVFAYDQGAAQRYADRYVFAYNVYDFWSNPYGYYEFDGNDCANFVSQCLTAGGLAQNNNWWYSYGFNSSVSWRTANGLKEYLKNNQGATLLGRWRRTASYNGNGVYFYAYVNNSNNIAGLGSEVVFYDWYDDGIMDHAAIIVGTNRPFKGKTGVMSGEQEVGDLVNAHTEDRQHQYWHLDTYNTRRNTTAVYAYRLK